MTSLLDRITSFNADRPADRVALKYQEMSVDAFSFLRGTCHLFYEDLPLEGVFKTAPAVWICGDLHLQNFGSFKGDDRLGLSKQGRKLVYFDINDFDEAVLAPCSWDLARFVVSLGVADLGLGEGETIELSQLFLKTYAETLTLGKAGTVHRETATGVVKDLLQNLKSRKRKSFIRSRLDPKVRALKRVPHKVLTAPDTDLHRIHRLVTQWSETQPQTQANPEFFKILDITQRIAGNGSLGLERYLILVQGKGYPEGSYLLDLKAARSSCLQPYLQTLQPMWKTEADRIVAVQSRIQDSPPAMLNVLTDVLADGMAEVGTAPNRNYVLRELQPTADKLDLATIAHHPKRLKQLVETLAQITAWGHLRSGGRQRSAIADDLIAFGHQTVWQTEILDYARHYRSQVKRDYQEFHGSHLALSRP
jgi:uncharacterized protein (DUF2252 family)